MTTAAISPQGMAYSEMLADLQTAIATGDLRAGDRLPSESALAKQYDISVASVRKGVDQLVESGAVQRRQGSGTYVNETAGGSVRRAAQDRIAMVIPLAIRGYHPFFSERAQGLRQRLVELGWQLDDWPATPRTDNRDVATLGIDTAALARTLRGPHSFAGLMIGASNAHDLRQALGGTLPLPVVACDMTDDCPWATYDLEAEAVRALRSLAQDGCKRILVCSGGQTPAKREALAAAAFAGLGGAAPALVWQPLQASSILSEHVRNAYDAVLDAVGRDPAIDGVFSDDDYHAQGAADALQKLDLPADGSVRLAAIVNKAHRISTHLPMTRLVLDGYQLGVVLAELLHEQIINPAQARKRVVLAATLEL